MEKTRMIALLEKYWQAETTIAEEQMLAEYFRRQDEPDPELAPYSELFLYFRQEAQVSAGPGFENRILQRVGLSARPDGLPTQPAGLSTRPDGLPARPAPSARPARTFRLGFIAAAASICAVVMGIFLLSPDAKQTPPAIASAGQSSPVVIASTIRDTYSDPGQALAAVRHALLIASTHLNEGRRSFTGLKK